MKKARLRKEFDITGTVQGVGLRPLLHSLALAHNLTGWAQNRSGTVRLVLEGFDSEMAQYFEHLQRTLPPAAHIEEIRELASEELEAHAGCSDFQIKESESGDLRQIAFPHDLAICSNCLEEVFNPGNRRYGYAFTTCTHCGPRYTVIHGMPYDRSRTTLERFPLCSACQTEYDDVHSRRFHAESIACSVCGPQLSLFDRSGVLSNGSILAEARRRLSQGQIVAVRGLGGFLLAADAKNPAAVRRLRELKQRPHKPLAVMVRSLDFLRACCEVPLAAEQALRSSRAPM